MEENQQQQQNSAMDSTTMAEKQQAWDSALPEGAVDISPDQKNGGVWKVVLKEGQPGPAVPRTGDACKVHYVGTLLDGTKFDSSRDRGEPFEFKLGRSQVIKGWDVAVGTMKKGELCKVFLKPEFAYGELGSEPRIPPNSPLVFEIELLSWEGEDISLEKDKSLLRTMIKDGEKYDTPNEGAKIRARIVGLYDGREFLREDDVEFVLGEASEAGLPEGVDRAVKRFKKGERALIRVHPRLAYGPQGNTDLRIPPNADVDFDIEVTAFEKAKQSWEMSDDEKLAEGGKLKQRGTEFFQQGKNKLAMSKYRALVDLLQHETTYDGEKKQRRDALMIAAHNNLAMVMLRTGETVEAIKQAEKVLELDGNNVKALYRKAQALQNQNDFDEAIKSYDAVLVLEADNKAAQSARIQCRARLAELVKREKAVYANIFQKLAKASSNNEESAAAQKPPPTSNSKSSENGLEKNDDNHESASATQTVP